ncbi:MAG TPA: 4a-hydroxytetrahydrobiopterin dehydratase [Rhodanobacteraceae bacterium]|nr:4a-hydroxytetrahydrobiopterin dehydratase [Rhodanobacteraceae bacterium]
MTLDQLSQQHCEARKGKEHALASADIAQYLALLPDWKQAADGNEICKQFKFKNFYRTMAFVNAVAWIANREDHHPDLEVGYAACLVRYSTHDVGGISLNDFICAAKVEALL